VENTKLINGFLNKRSRLIAHLECCLQWLKDAEEAGKFGQYNYPAKGMARMFYPYCIRAANDFRLAPFDELIILNREYAPLGASQSFWSNIHFDYEAPEFDYCRIPARFVEQFQSKPFIHYEMENHFYLSEEMPFCLGYTRKQNKEWIAKIEKLIAILVGGVSK
jgi:hypothetical protein